MLALMSWFKVTTLVVQLISALQFPGAPWRQEDIVLTTSRCVKSFFFEQIELQAKLLNYFLGSNKSNINQIWILQKHSTALKIYTNTQPPQRVAFRVWPSGVRSLKEKWERNGKGIYEGYGQNYGNGKGTRNPAIKKSDAGIFFWESLASPTRCLRRFWTNFSGV